MEPNKNLSIKKKKKKKKKKQFFIMALSYGNEVYYLEKEEKQNQIEVKSF